MTSEYEQLGVLRQQLIDLRQEEGATPERIVKFPQLMEVLGATDPVEAVASLRQAIETLAKDGAASGLRPKTVEDARRITLNSFGFGESTASGLNARRADMMNRLGASMKTIKNGEQRALSLLLGRLTGSHIEVGEEEAGEVPLPDPTPTKRGRRLTKRSVFAGAALLVVVLLSVGVAAYASHSDEPTNTVLNKPHKDFLTMRASDQIDACAPYVRDKQESTYIEWVRHWESKGMGGFVPVSEFGSANANDSVQRIVDRRTLVMEMARNEPDPNISANVLSCAFLNGKYDKYAAVAAPRAHYTVMKPVAASGTFSSGKFSGVTAAPYVNRIIQDEGCQALMTLMSGRNPANQAWIERVTVCDKNSKSWSNDLSAWGK